LGILGNDDGTTQKYLSSWFVKEDGDTRMASTAAASRRGKVRVVRCTHDVELKVRRSPTKHD